MNKYKVEICNSPNWQSFDTATFGVSIESPNWRGEKLEAILDFASKRFRRIRIDVTDALYRHKLMAAKIEEEAAFCGAQALGSLWLSQHIDLIDACPVEKEIIRWEEWYEHDAYRNTLESFKHAFKNNVFFHDAVREDAETFCRRQNRLITGEMLRRSIDFLIEEVAVLSLQAMETKSVRLYPGEELACMQVVRRGLVPEAPNWLQNEQFAKIRLKVRNSFKAVHHEKNLAFIPAY